LNPLQVHPGVDRLDLRGGAVPPLNLKVFPLAEIAFGPEQIEEIVSAFEGVLAELNLTDRNDPATELVARKILECAVTGEIDRHRLRERALAAFKATPSSAPIDVPMLPVQRHPP